MVQSLPRTHSCETYAQPCPRIPFPVKIEDHVAHRAAYGKRAKEAVMFQHILIPTDGSELSRKAVTGGIALAKSMGARITVVMASSPFHIVATMPRMVTDTKDQYLKDAEASARTHLQDADELARASGVRCDTAHVFDEHPYRVIIETAQARECDLIVMASHGRRGIAAVLLGSETQKVLTHCTIPVLVWR
jgi:nucleotide-binding universal stress UspA family protein